MSNDDARHYLNGIYIHPTTSNKSMYLTGVATDTHRLSSSSTPLEESKNFKPFILPKKTVFQLCTLLENYDGDVKISNLKSTYSPAFKNFN